MSFALYKGKVYKCHGRTKGFNNCCYSLASKITLIDGLLEKTVLNSECRLFTQVFLLVKYEKKWYSLPNEIVCDNGKICLVGEQQEGFEFEYVDAGFPVYSKSVNFPQDISEVIIRVTEVTYRNNLLQGIITFL